MQAVARPMPIDAQCTAYVNGKVGSFCRFMREFYPQLATFLFLTFFPAFANS